jgi:hypothetical protein
MVQNVMARIGHSQADAAGERKDIVVQRTVGAICHDRDRPKDQRVLGNRLATHAGNQGFTSAKKHLRPVSIFHLCAVSESMSNG